MKDETKFVGSRIPADLAQQFKIELAKRKEKATAVIERMIREYVNAKHR